MLLSDNYFRKSLFIIMLTNQSMNKTPTIDGPAGKSYSIDTNKPLTPAIIPKIGHK